MKLTKVEVDTYSVNAFIEAQLAMRMRLSIYPPENNTIHVCINMHEPSYRKRLYLFDWSSNTIISAHHVSHGLKSSSVEDPAIANSFSNTPGSNKTSLGLYKIGETYQGKHGYSCKLQGLDITNSKAFERGIVFHSADYVTDKFILDHGYAGRSEGCPALDPIVANNIVNSVKGSGHYLYIYY